MEISWLQDFISLAQTGVFARAAEKRNVTQPAFTRRIKRLEYAVGANLIDRSVHPVVLTPAGKTFLSTAQSMVYEWEKTRAELSEDGPKVEKVKIATLQSLAVSYMPNLIKTLFPDGRAPSFQVAADNFAGCIEAIISGDADVMICYAHKDIQTGDHVLDEESFTLGSDRLIPVSLAENGRAKFSLHDRSVPFLKYSSMSFLGRVTNLMLGDAGTDLPLTTVYEDSIAAALKSAALEGLGVGWLPEALVKHELDSGCLINIAGGVSDFEIPISVTVYRGRRPTSRSFERFWTALSIKLGTGDTTDFTYTK